MGAGMINGTRFLVTELLTGMSIERSLWGTPRESLTQLSRLVWARDVAMGMEYIHSRGFIHRDLKTPNILHDVVSGRAKIADFGLGKSIADGRSGSPFVDKDKAFRTARTMRRASTNRTNSQ